MNNSKVAKRVRDDGEQCTADDVQRLVDSLDKDGKKWLKGAKASDAEKWAFDVLRNSQPPL